MLISLKNASSVVAWSDSRPFLVRLDSVERSDVQKKLKKRNLAVTFFYDASP